MTSSWAWVEARSHADPLWYPRLGRRRARGARAGHRSGPGSEIGLARSRRRGRRIPRHRERANVPFYEHRGFRVADTDGSRRRAADLVHAVRLGGTRAVTIPIVLDCDPGHDDAIALLLALASPELELLGVTTQYGNRHSTRRRRTRSGCSSWRSHRHSGRCGAEPPTRESSSSPRTFTARAAWTARAAPPRTQAVEQHAVDFLVERIAASPQPVTLVPTGR